MTKVTLELCPEGLFWYGGELCFKSEYQSRIPFQKNEQDDAFVVRTGEYFWGGAQTAKTRAKLMVLPVNYEAAVAAITRGMEETK